MHRSYSPTLSIGNTGNNYHSFRFLSFVSLFLNNNNNNDSETPWSNRWDQYLANTDSQIHWFSIINSVMIVLFLTGMVAMIMMRTLHADFRRYNQVIRKKKKNLFSNTNNNLFIYLFSWNQMRRLKRLAGSSFTAMSFDRRKCQCCCQSWLAVVFKYKRRKREMIK